MGRTSMDSTVSPASADLQMPSLTDFFFQENTLYGSVNASRREPQHYFFIVIPSQVQVLDTHVPAWLLLVLLTLGGGHQTPDAGLC